MHTCRGASTPSRMRLPFTSSTTTVMSLAIRIFSPAFLLRTNIAILLLDEKCKHWKVASYRGGRFEQIEPLPLNHRKKRCTLRGMKWLNYHHLLYFWTVAREGSIVRACAQLHLTQPTISGQLRCLEKTLGRKLFQRAGRNLVLSDTGRLVFRYADEIFSLGREL